MDVGRRLSNPVAVRSVARGTLPSAEALHDQQGGPRQDRRCTESEMGGAEKATGATGPASEAQEAEVVGGRAEGDKGSHEKALGGLPQG